MALAHVNTQNNASTGATSLVITKPTGLAEGNLMVAVIVTEHATGAINSVPTGFFLLYRSPIGTRTHTQYAYYKIATASDAGATNFTFGFSATVECAGFITAWSGVKTSAPIGNFYWSTANASSVNAVAPSIQVRANNVVLAIGSNMYGTTWTAPSGSPTYTEICDKLSAASSSGLSVHCSWATYTSTGNTGTKTCVAALADYWKAAHIEIVDAGYADEIPEIFAPPAPHGLRLNKYHHHAQTLIWAHVFTHCGGGAKVEDVATRFVTSDIIGGAQVDKSGYLSLDGNDDCVKFPTSIGTFFSHIKSSFAVGFRWREPRADGSFSQIFMACSSSASFPKLAMRVSTSGQLSVGVTGTTSTNYYDLTVHENLKNGQWYHVYVSQFGDNARIYINGKYVTQTALLGGSGAQSYWFNQVTGTIQYCLGAWWQATTYDYANIDLAYFYYWDDEGQYNGQSGFPAVFTHDPYAMFRLPARSWLNKAIQGATLLQVADLGHAHALEDAGALTQKHILAVAELAHGHVLDAAGTLVEKHLLQPADHGHAHGLEDAGALTQKHTLAVAELAHPHGQEDAGALIQKHLLAVAELAHGHGLDAGALTQKHTLTVAELAHGHALEAVELSSAATLAPADLAHGHALNAVELILARTTLQVADHGHGHGLEDAGAIAQKHLLAAAELAHGHALDDAGTLVEKHLLAVADLDHAHQLDAAQLVQRHLLLSAGLLHGHSLENAVFITAVGRVMVALSAARPKIAFAAVVPEVAFESVAPGIAFSAVKPGVAFAAVRPAVNFTAN